MGQGEGSLRKATLKFIKETIVPRHPQHWALQFFKSPTTSLSVEPTLLTVQDY